MSRHAFVTGGGGFIGSHLVEALLSGGWEVTALLRYNSRNHWGWLENHHARPPARLHVVAGDVRDAAFVAQAMAGADTVFHLAALIGVPYSFEAPASYFDTNLSGTLHLAEAARRAHVRRFVHTSTSEVYGTACRVPIDPGHPLRAQSPYAASKIAADKLIESFVHSYALPAVTVRPFNAYGPRQSDRAVIPTILTQALTTRRVRLGALKPRRDFTFVSDLVEAFIRAADAPHVVGEVVDVASGQSVSIEALVHLCFQVLGVEADIEPDPERLRPHESEVEVLCGDPSRAADLLGWRPRVPLRDGLAQTAAWLESAAASRHPHEYAR
jgi:dTDP-glucose 4,6-dehydratase